LLARHPGVIPNIALGGAALVGGAVFALGLYSVNPLLLPALVLGAGFLVVAFARPAYGAAGALFATSLDVFHIQLPVSAISPSEAAFAVVAASWFARIVVRPESVARPALRDIPIAVLLLAVAVGVVHAEDPAPVVRVTILWSLFYLVYLQAQAFSVSEMRHIIIAFALGAAILGAYGAVTYLQAGDAQLFAGGAFTSQRAVATFDDPNYYAALLTLALLPTLALVLYGIRRYAWLLLPAAAIFGGLVFSLSRGAMLGFAVGLLLMLTWRRARRVALVIAAVLIGLTAANANPIVHSDYFGTVEQRLSTLQHPTQESRRPQIWAAALDMAEQHPFFGIGVNQFQLQAVKLNLYERGEPLENAHDVYLSLAAETGFLGLAAFLAFVAVVGSRAAAAIAAGRGAFALALGLSAAMLAYLVQGMTSAQIRVPVLVATFLLYAGMITGLADRARQSVPERSSGRPPLPDAAVVEAR
jgi:O-antigen ligase